MPENISSTNPGEPAFYTAREFALKTNLSYQTVLRLIERKKLKCMPFCRHKRIPASELERWKNAQF